MRPVNLLLASAALLAACAPDPDTHAEGGPFSPSTGSPSPRSVVDEIDRPPAPSANATELPADHLAPDDPAPARQPLAADLVRREWARAANRKACAPLFLTSDAGASARPRAAHFAGGWAVAFDLPGQRSAYGIAGTGVLDEDRLPADQAELQLRGQWPYFVSLRDLPQPAYAGYGLEGAKAYGDADPDGRGENSLAYVRVGGQRCLYNVWSRLGRAHLEALLDLLRRS